MRVSFKAAVKLLQEGDVVGIPTETVYGLAACIGQPEAVAKIYALKNRPSNNPLIIHCASEKQLSSYLEETPPYFAQLAERFWPGPMTLVMPIKSVSVPAIVRSGLPTAAFRIPAHPLARLLIEETGPLVMPSANLSGRPSATSPEHVEQDFGSNFPVFDGGICERGVESTILYWNGNRWEIARLGALAPSAFRPLLGERLEYFSLVKEKKEAPLCPGQLFRHYAPHAELVLFEEFPADAEGIVIGFTDRLYPAGCRLIPLSSSDEPETAAKNLYACLRQLDEQGIQKAFVDINMPDENLWLTLKERLRKAAAK